MLLGDLRVGHWASLEAEALSDGVTSTGALGGGARMNDKGGGLREAERKGTSEYR